MVFDLPLTREGDGGLSGSDARNWFKPSIHALKAGMVFILLRQAVS